MNYNYIKKVTLNDLEMNKIIELEKKCFDYDKVNVKLELEYKKMCIEDDSSLVNDQMNEFLCLNNQKIIGYIGVCDFGGNAIEINGLVDPDYRQQGIFTELFTMCMASLPKRKSNLKLLLSDSNSKSGISFINRYTNVLHHCEYEMYLDTFFIQSQALCDIELRLATNKDAYEIDQQNKIYFTEDVDGDEINLSLINPEDEIAKGFNSYLAIYNKQIVGKVNIQYSDTVSGIYGLGVKPEFRSKGLGRGILKKAIDMIKAESASQIMLQVEVENDNALNLYRSCGFQETYSMNYYKL